MSLHKLSCIALVKEKYKVKIKETQISALIKQNDSRLREAVQNTTHPKFLAPT
jgi:hypothetical protein